MNCRSAQIAHPGKFRDIELPGLIGWVMPEKYIADAANSVLSSHSFYLLTTTYRLFPHRTPTLYPNTCSCFPETFLPGRQERFLQRTAQTTGGLQPDSENFRLFFREWRYIVSMCREILPLEKAVVSSGGILL